MSEAQQARPLRAGWDERARAAQDRPVFKAFAKHLKLDAQRALLAAERFGMAAGTPARLAQLAALGALRVGGLRLLVVDVRANDKQQCAPACPAPVC